MLLLRQALNELHLVDDRARVLIELFALVGQRNALVRAVEDAHLEFVFQIADGLAQIGLRDKQLLRGLVDAALLRNGDKVGKLLNLHNSVPSFACSIFSIAYPGGKCQPYFYGEYS